MPEHTIALTLVPSPEHVLAGHPESPERFRDLARLRDVPFADRCLWLEPQPAAEAALVSVHPPAYLRALEAAAAQGPAYVDPAPTYVAPGSYQAALVAAGGSLGVVEAIADGRARSGFALVRPPGHHATATEPMGFCLLNNVALAARRVQALGLRRVMIVDIDVHHGNGTQAIFEQDPEVLYLSTHESGIYPGTGALGERGRGPGEGHVVDIPLPGRAGDACFASVASRVIAPAARRFAPDVLLVSVGFDAHWRDPLAELGLSCSGYFTMAQGLVALAEALCRGRIAFVLEGGYDPQVVAAGALAVLHALAGQPAPLDPFGPSPFVEPDIGPLLDRVTSLHGL